MYKTHLLRFDGHAFCGVKNPLLHMSYGTVSGDSLEDEGNACKRCLQKLHRVGAWGSFKVIPSDRTKVKPRDRGVGDTF